MDTPVMMPIYTSNNDDERCPKCNKKEHRVEVCKHCGYEYEEEEDFTTGEKWMLFFIIVLFFYILITLICWFVESPESTLLDIIKSQFKWIISLRIF